MHLLSLTLRFNWPLQIPSQHSVAIASTRLPIQLLGINHDHVRIQVLRALRKLGRTCVLAYSPKQQPRRVLR
jgi:hypothetical protein